LSNLLGIILALGMHLHPAGTPSLPLAIAMFLGPVYFTPRETEGVIGQYCSHTCNIPSQSDDDVGLLTNDMTSASENRFRSVVFTNIIK